MPMSQFQVDAMGVVNSNSMLPLSIRKVHSSLANQHLMTIGDGHKPEGEGGFHNGPNYLVDSPSQNDLGCDKGSSNQTNGKSKAS